MDKELCQGCKCKTCGWRLKESCSKNDIVNCTRFWEETDIHCGVRNCSEYQDYSNKEV